MGNEAVPGKPLDTFNAYAETMRLLDAAEGSPGDGLRDSDSLEQEGKKENSGQARESNPCENSNELLHILPGLERGGHEPSNGSIGTALGLPFLSQLDADGAGLIIRLSLLMHKPDAFAEQPEFNTAQLVRARGRVPLNRSLQC